MSDKAKKLRAFLKREAELLAFDDFGIVCARDSDNDEKRIDDLRRYLRANHHGQMEWMARHRARRERAKTLWRDVRSIIVLAMNYGPERDPLEILKEPKKGAISVYAQNRDYHNVLKGRLKTLGAKFLSRARALSLEGQVKVFVDTAPIMEKPLAARAGLGWQGKHTNLVSRRFGSWTFLGTIFTDLDLPPDEPMPDRCGSCRSCLDICPTNAFPAPYQLDARKCISYLTIEHDGLIDEQYRPLMGNRIYGCDDCLAVCPWNKFAQKAARMEFTSEKGPPPLAELLALDDAAFKSRFGASPVRRIGRARFVRNCLIAAGNSGDRQLRPQVENLMKDGDSVIRQTAHWAFEQLSEA